MKSNDQEILWPLIDIRDKTLEKMRAQLTDKEAVIQELKTAHAEAQVQLEQSEKLLQQQGSELAENKHLLAASEARETATNIANKAVITELKKAYKDAQANLKQYGNIIEQQNNELVECRRELKACEKSSAQLADRDRIISLLDDAKTSLNVNGSGETNLALVKGLEEKEAVIKELAKALDAYRGAFGLLGWLIRPAIRLMVAIAGLKNSLIAKVAPRLGKLNQYPPRALRLPKSYQKTITLAETPQVSIVTPSFRQAAFISRTIQSVLNQDYPDLEYFVQDGGSDDGTVEILNSVENSLAGWESKPDSGQSHAINQGFAHTSGDIMAWLNSDDLLLPGAIHTVVQYFNLHPQVDVVYGNRLLIDENDREIGRWVLPGHDNEVLSWVDFIPQETLFWRRRIWDRVGSQVDESFRFAMDWDLLVRMRDLGAKFAHIPRFLGAFRIHEHQKTSANINEIGHQEMDRIRKRLLGEVPEYKEVRKAIFPYLLKHKVFDLAHGIKVGLQERF